VDWTTFHNGVLGRSVCKRTWWAMNARVFVGLVFLTEVILEAGFRLKTNLAQGLSLKNVFLYGLLLVSLGNVFANIRRHPRVVRNAYIALLLLGLLASASVLFAPDLQGYRQYQPLAQLLGVKGLLFDSLIVLLVFSAALPRATDYWRVICYIITIVAAFVALMLIEVRLPGLNLYGFVTDDQRPRGPFGEPNQTAAVLALVLPLAIVSAIRSKGIGRFSSGFLAALIAAGLVVTGSRGGIVAATFGLGLLAIAIRKEVGISAKVLVISAIPVVLVVGWTLLPAQYQVLIEKRVVSIVDTQSDISKTSAGRTILWGEAVKQWEDAPILGHGWGYFREATGNVTHNEFLVFLVDTGAIGLGLYLVVWSCVLRIIFLAKRSGLGDKLVLTAYQAGIGSLLVAIFFVNLYLPWLVVWGVVGLIVAHCSSLVVLSRRATTLPGPSGAYVGSSILLEQRRGYQRPQNGTSR